MVNFPFFALNEALSGAIAFAAAFITAEVAKDIPAFTTPPPKTPLTNAWAAPLLISPPPCLLLRKSFAYLFEISSSSKFPYVSRIQCVSNTLSS